MTARPDAPPPHAVAKPAAKTWTTRRRILVAATIFVLASLLYLPTLRNEFVWDDLALIENFDIRTLDLSTLSRLFTTNFWEASETHSGLYRPLTALSFHTDYQLYGDNPAGFHLTNVLLNATVCVLVFLVLLELFARPDVALASAVFFAAFPMHVENVAWVSGRTDLIATLFMLASLGCYAFWRRRPRALSLAGVFVFLAAALLGKETAVVLPAVIAVLEFLPLPSGGRSASRWAGRTAVAGMFVMVALYFLLRKHVLGSALLYFSRFTSGVVSGVAFSLSIFAHYAYKLLFPFRLDAESDFPPPDTFWNVHTLVGMVIVTAGIYALYRWRRHRPFVFASAVIALGLAPVLNILPLNQVTAERFLYFPSLGFALLVSLAFSALKRRRTPALLVFVGVIAALSSRTVARTFDWKDELTLFKKTVEVSGDNARARASLGSSLYQRGQYDQAINQFRRATEVNPSYAPGWNGLARTAGKLGHVDDALGYMETAIALDPDNALFFHNLGVLQFQARHYAEAAASFRRALEIRPRHLHARFNLGLALYQQGDFDGTIRELSALEHKDTDFVNAYYFIAEAESRRGNPAAAARAASRFLALHPADDTLASRARELASRGSP